MSKDNVIAIKKPDDFVDDPIWGWAQNSVSASNRLL
jgi:hypothetical protein